MFGGLHAVDIIILVLFLGFCLYMGLKNSSGIRNITDYAVGSRNFHDVVLISTIMGTAISASATTGTVEKIYTHGILFAISRMFLPLTWWVTMKLYAPRIDKFRGCISVSDMMAKTYGEVGRWVTNVAAILLAVSAVAVQATAFGYTLSYIMGVNFQIGMIAGIIIITLYSAAGGVKSVAFTDVFQVCVFLVAIPAACASAYNDLGGYQNVLDSIPEELLTITFTKENMIFFVSAVLYSIMPLGEGAYFQRFLMAKNVAQLVRVFKVLTIITTPFIFLLCLTGFLVKARVPDIDPSYAFTYFVANFLTIGVKGIVVAGIMAVIMSTADSWLNTASVLCAHDIAKRLYLKFFNIEIDGKKELRIARISLVVISAIACIISLSEKSVMSLAWMADNFWQPIVLIPITAGFLGFGTNTRSFIFSVIFAIIFNVFGIYVEGGELGLFSLMMGLLGSFVGLVGMHYFQKLFMGVKFLEKKEENNRVFASFETGKGVMRHQTRTEVSTPLLKKVENFMIRQAMRSKLRNYAFCFVTIVNYIIPMFNNKLSGNILADSVIHFRVLSMLFCAILLVVELWPSTLREKFYHIYWYICLLFCLSFVPCYTFFTSGSDDFLILNSVLSLILLFILLDLASFITLMFVGVVLSYSMYKILVSYSPIYVEVETSHDLFLLLYLYASLSIVMIFFVRGKEREQENRMMELSVLNGAIAHEINAPIATSETLAFTLLEITESVEVHNEEDNVKRVSMGNEEYELLFNHIPKEILRSISEARKIIQLLFQLVRQNSCENFEIISIREIVKEVIDSPFITAFQRSKIQFDENIDFRFNGDRQSIKQIISNVVRNAFKHGGEDVNVDIWVLDNKLHIRDNGVGIDEKTAKNIFKSFYSKKGTLGIGLPFSSILLNYMGGEIECYSEVGMYTEIVVVLPGNL
ncbi:Solute carrier and signal transduction histidine kinase domain protein [Candidatus Cyrtobacter comes]|uniref:histidine kinase n=2 Tax=Candidatus Cyrtobacter comes TaxID=675776 RepID=A0ABU5L6G0_9RICK|nr:Solute carrier and signal transduction histidine kinase domain protein [Candidatus Cyrtobacter comes]